MKTKYVLLSAVLTVIVTSPLFARDHLADTTKSAMKQPDVSSMLGKPTAEASVGGLHMRVWLVAQEKQRDIVKEKMPQMPMHGEKQGDMGRMEMAEIGHPTMTMPKDMKGLPRGGVGMKAFSVSTDKDTVDAGNRSSVMNTAVRDSMIAGTHHIVLDVTEIASGKEVVGTSARVLIESPSKKSSSVDLPSTMKHFENALTLDEKGEYRFTVMVSLGGVTKSTQFPYAVK